jgi:hypothetical protein
MSVAEVNFCTEAFEIKLVAIEAFAFKLSYKPAASFAEVKCDL